MTVHLSFIVAATLALALKLGAGSDDAWFTWTRLRPVNRIRAGAAALVALVTGYSALVTLASSAALGYDPSLQFLQLLSALDIAWSTAALYLGVRWMGGVRVALVAALALGAVCVWSIWSYLQAVGFGPEGAWVVSRPDLLRYVLPFDLGAAVMALLAIAIGSRSATATAVPASSQTA